MCDDPVLLLTEASRTFGVGAAGVTALDGVSLEVRRGSSTAIVGRSGSGKSTLLAILGLLDHATSGRYVVRGRDTSDLSPGQLDALRAETFGFVFQAFHLLPYLSVAESVEMGLTYRARLGARERRRRVAEIIDAVGLSHRRDARTATLSGGEKQRTAIARALVGEPAVILADEPTGNLDETSASEVLAIFDSAVRAGVAVVLVTHDQPTAARAGKTIRLRDGRAVA